MKVNIENKKEEKKTLSILFKLFLESLQEEVNFKNKIADKFQQESWNKPIKNLLELKWLNEYGLSINNGFTKVKVKKLVREVNVDYKKQYDIFFRNRTKKTTSCKIPDA